MDQEDSLFEDIRALCDEAEDLGFADVALVLEFALDVFLKEYGSDTPPKPADAMQALTRAADTIATRRAAAPQHLPRLGWSMAAFPLAELDRKAS